MKELEPEKSYEMEPLLDDSFEIVIGSKRWGGFIAFDDVYSMEDDGEIPQELLNKGDRVDVEPGYVYWLPFGVPEEFEGKSSYTYNNFENGFLTLELILSSKDPSIVTTTFEDVEDKIPLCVKLTTQGKTFYSLGEVRPPGEYPFADKDAWTVKHKLNWYRKDVDGVSGPIFVPKANPSYDLSVEPPKEGESKVDQVLSLFAQHQKQDPFKPSRNVNNGRLSIHKVKDIKMLKFQIGWPSSLLNEPQ